MNINKKTTPLFEVAIKVERHPLPPYYETFLNNLTGSEAEAVVKTLFTLDESVFVLEEK